MLSGTGARTNADILSRRPWRTYFNEMFKVKMYSFKMMHFRNIVSKWWPSRARLYMLPEDPFQYKWLKGYIYSSSYHHHQIGSIHLSHCCHIFPWLCEMFVTSYSYTYCIYIMGKPGICFHNYCAESANSRIRFGLKIVFVYLYITPSHYHHCANLSEDIELINFLSDIFCRVRE